MNSKKSVLSQAQLARINAPIEEARSLPAESYISTEFYEAEIANIFCRHWVSALYEFDVPEPGQALPFDFCGLPLLAVRDVEGQLRVFHNVVPYDGCLAVLEPLQGLEHIETPFHGWLYDLQGQLLATPYWNGSAESSLHSVEQFETDLREVPSEVFLHTVFINLSAEPDSFQDFIAPIARQFPEYDLAGAAIATNTSGLPIVRSAETKCNWKIFFDIDGPNVLHEQFVHKDYRESSLHPRVTSQGEKTYREIIDGYLIGLGFQHADFAETYGSIDPNKPHLGREGRLPTQAAFVDLYPAMSLSFSPDYIEVAINLPAGVDRTIDRRMYLMPAVEVTEEGAAHREKVLGFHGAVAPEDNRISEAIQKAAYSPVYTERFFSPFWDTMRHQFHRWVAKDLSR